jgi:hypothetical protein
VALKRFARGGTVGGEPAAVVLEMSETVEVLVDIPGLVSCTQIGAQAECPAGQLCGDDLRCQ